MKKALYLFLAASILLAGCGSSVQSSEGRAPEFALEDTAGQMVRLSDYSGKVVILNFFATWCPPCRAEIPDFVELVKDYGNNGLVIIGISVDSGDRKKVSDFANDNKINYPVLFDNGLISAAYGNIKSIPTTFIINKDGMIVNKVVGSRDKRFFEGAVKPLL